LRREGPADRDDWGRFLRMLQAQARLFTLERDRLRVARPAPVTLHDFQHSLPPRTAFLSFLRASLGGSRRQTRGPMRDVLYLCVVRPDRPVEWVRVWDVASPSALDRVSLSWHAMESMRTRASQWRYRIEPDAGYADTLRALGQTFFDPLEHALDGIDAIIAEYPLSGFPLEHMRDAAGRYLIDRFVFSYVPSATVAQLLGQRAAVSPHVAHDRALVVGDPDLAPVEDRGWRRYFAGASASPGDRGATRESLSVLPRLVHAGDEVRAVSATFPHATALVRERASEGALQDLAEHGELLSFRSL